MGCLLYRYPEITPAIVISGWSEERKQTGPPEKPGLLCPSNNSKMSLLDLMIDDIQAFFTKGTGEVSPGRFCKMLS